MLQKKTLNTKPQSGHKAHEDKKMKIILIFLGGFVFEDSFAKKTKI
jgi:hypothetical protein